MRGLPRGRFLDRVGGQRCASGWTGYAC